MEGQLPQRVQPELRSTSHREIACDESGFSGGNLVGAGHSPVFAHASLLIDRDTAAAVVDHIRQSIAAKSGEYKSAELHRPRHRGVLLWLLDPAGPLPGIARIHLTNNRFFVLARVIDVLLGRRAVSGADCPGREVAGRQMALALYRSAEECYGARSWSEFLTAAANVLRTNNRWLPAMPVAAFYAIVDDLAARPARAEVSGVMARLSGTRPVAERTRSLHLQNPKRTPLMEPLIPAVACAIESWGSTAETISVVHDEQSALTPERIADLTARFADRHPGQQLTGVRLVDSRSDARIQLADFVAGIAHRVARSELHGSPDPELIRLLRPMIDSASVWADGPSAQDGSC